MGMVRTTCGVCDTNGPVEVYRRLRWSTQMMSNILCVMLGWIMFGVRKVSWCVERLTGTRRFGVEEPFWENTGCSPGRVDLKQRIRRWRKSICRRDEARAVRIQCASTKDGTILSPPLVSNWSVTYTLKLLRMRGVIGRSTLLGDGAAIDLEHNNSSWRPSRSVLAQLWNEPWWSLTEPDAT